MEEYRAYYDARAERYAGNPYRRHSYEAECKLRDLFYKYDTFEEMTSEAVPLSQACAFAAWRDQYEMESQYYESVQEPVRKKGADQILAQLDDNADLTGTMSKITDITNDNSVEITADEGSGKALLDNWSRLDDIEAHLNAEVPNMYKGEMASRAEKIRQELRDTVQDTEKTLGDWQNGWRLRPDTALEPRYRSLIPYSDDEVEQHLRTYKEITHR